MGTALALSEDLPGVGVFVSCGEVIGFGAVINLGR